MVLSVPLLGAGMANFFAELKRRHIYRVGAAYVVAAWAVAQVIDLLSQVFALPSWIAQPVIVLIAVGFPIALVIAWVAESKPQQVIASAVRSKPTAVDWMLFSAVAVLIALSGYRLIAPSSDPETRQVGAISVAVLPFANLSGDASQEFFSDGMTEEITSALAKVPGMIVIGRTSAFAFKGQNKDLRTIGQALGTTHLIEGSVRKAGTRVRITAQLIIADSGAHLWTESYDRELTDVFAIQDDIAQAIAGALRAPLGLQQGETLVRNRTSDAESYDQYLRAKALVDARSYTEAINLLEPLTTRDPNYAPAWALLAGAHAGAPNFHPALWNGEVEELRRIAAISLPKAEAAARRAIALDPELPNGYVALGSVQARRAKLLLAQEFYAKARALDPSNPEVLSSESSLVGGTGFVKEALLMRQRLLALEPFVPIFRATTAAAQWVNGQTDAAIDIFKDLPDGPARSGSTDLARIYAAAGRYGEAADVVSAMSGPFARGTVEAATRLLRTAPTDAGSTQTLPRLGGFEFVYLYVGVPDRALEFYEGSVEAGYSATNFIWLWHPSYAAVRKTERFKNLVRSAGIVEYWRAKGWPEFCRPTTGDDFECT